MLSFPNVALSQQCPLPLTIMPGTPSQSCPLAIMPLTIMTPHHHAPHNHASCSLTILSLTIMPPRHLVPLPHAGASEQVPRASLQCGVCPQGDGGLGEEKHSKTDGLIHFFVEQ